EERGTVLLLQLHLRGSMGYAGKLVFNVLLVGAMNALAALGFLVVLGLEVEAPGLLAAALGLGALGLAGATTLLSAIIARTANGGPLLAVLAFPMLVPLLLSVVRVTQRALLLGASAGPWAASVDDLVALGAYAGVVITASVLLFDYAWNDSRRRPLCATPISAPCASRSPSPAAYDHAPHVRLRLPRLHRRHRRVDDRRDRSRAGAGDPPAEHPRRDGAQPLFPRPDVVHADGRDVRLGVPLGARARLGPPRPRRARRAGRARGDGLRPARPRHRDGVGALHVVRRHREVVELRPEAVDGSRAAADLRRVLRPALLDRGAEEAGADRGGLQPLRRRDGAVPALHPAAPDAESPPRQRGQPRLQPDRPRAGDADHFLPRRPRLPGALLVDLHAARPHHRDRADARRLARTGSAPGLAPSPTPDANAPDR